LWAPLAGAVVVAPVAALVVVLAVAALLGVMAAFDELPVVVWPAAASARRVRQTPSPAEYVLREFIVISK
jgi:hypothetical protein